MLTPSEISTTELINKLTKMFPNAKCELEYNDLFQLIIAVVLSAQTTDIAVNKVTRKLFIKYPSYKELSSAYIVDVEDIIKSIGLYHNKAKNIIALANKYQYLDINNISREQLMELPGVGRKTANVVLGEYFHIPAIAVDTHVKRVCERIGLAIGNPLQIEKQLMNTFDENSWNKLHIMLVFLGRYVCKAQHPKCSECLLNCKK